MFKLGQLSKLRNKQRESEERYRNILESIGEGYYEVDLPGNFTFFNDSICQIYGYPREELMGMNDRQLLDKETAKRTFQAFNKVYKTGEPCRGFVHNIIRKDGAQKHVETSMTLKKDPTGKPVGFRGIIRDITERKQMEEILKQSEQRYRTLVDSSKDAILVLDTQRNIISCNQSFLNLFGYEKK